MCSSSNSTPVPSYTYSSAWINHKDADQNTWIVRQTNDFYKAHISSSQGEITKKDRTLNDDPKNKSKPLKEKNLKKTGYKHVPHKDKPPQAVAKRNARERRRVQAVNSAFLRLRKAVPIPNNRGKRISKVKTLQNAIQYILDLEQLLQEDGQYCSINSSNIFQKSFKEEEDLFQNLTFINEF